MGKVLRLLMIYICVPIYDIIPRAYDLFYSLANHRFFEDGTIDKFSSNIYVLTCVVMLFAFSANLLAAIVNPDLMDDKEKGVGAMFKKALFGVVLIVLVPIAFDEAYTIQQNVMENSLIEKVLLGLSWDNDDEGTGGGNGGQVIAGTLMASVLYPVELQDGSTVQVASEDAVTYYNKMISEDISAISKFAKYVNEEAQSEDGNELKDTHGDAVEYAFEFQSLVAVVGGAVCIYILVMYAIDMAVRSVKLGLLELIAPISIVSYIAGGSDILKRWAQETGKTFLDVFVRIAIMSFYIYAIYIFGQDSFFDDLGWFASALLIVGLLILVQQLPNLIGNIFGINTESKGGIGGRLGQMAGVGKLAQNGWNKVTKGLGTAALLGSAGAAVGTGKALGYLGKKLDNRFLDGKVQDKGQEIVGKMKTGVNNFKDSEISQGIGYTGKAFAAGMKKGGLSGVSEAVKTYKENSESSNKKTDKEKAKQNQLLKSMNINPETKQYAAQEAERNATSQIDAMKDSINGNSDLTSAQKMALTNKVNADTRKLVLERYSENFKGVTDKLSQMASTAENSGNTIVADKLKELKNDFSSGTKPASKVTEELQKLVNSGSISSFDASGVCKNLTKAESIATSAQNAKILTASEVNQMNSSSGLNRLIEGVNNVVTTTDENLKNIKDLASKSSQSTIDTFTTASDILTKEAAYQHQGNTATDYTIDPYNGGTSTGGLGLNININAAGSGGGVNEGGNNTTYKLKEETLSEKIDKNLGINDDVSYDRSILQDDLNDLFNSDEYSDYKKQHDIKPNFKLKDDDNNNQ